VHHRVGRREFRAAQERQQLDGIADHDAGALRRVADEGGAVDDPSGGAHPEVADFRDRAVTGGVGDTMPNSSARSWSIAPGMDSGSVQELGSGPVFFVPIRRMKSMSPPALHRGRRKAIAWSQKPRRPPRLCSSLTISMTVNTCASDPMINVLSRTLAGSSREKRC
jgi:hypothetical protein